MRVTHILQVNAKCPENGATDSYRVVVRTDRLIKVEEIQAVAEKLTQEPVYQEALTQQLAAAIGCEVETHGRHSGVETVVVCP